MVRVEDMGQPILWNKGMPAPEAPPTCAISCQIDSLTIVTIKHQAIKQLSTKWGGLEWNWGLQRAPHGLILYRAERTGVEVVLVLLCTCSCGNNIVLSLLLLQQ